MRIEPSGFPLSFSVSDADMMMGGEWPEEVWISARLDVDGNAMTRSEGDMESLMLGPVSSGTVDIALTLDAGGILAE